jgi:hypothetical protein
MIVNKLMRDSKSLNIQGLALLLIGSDKANIGELSSAVFFIILFTLRKSRGYPISFVAEGSRQMTTASPSVALDMRHPRLSIN